MSRVTKIDVLQLPDHFYLTEQDECYFYGEYQPRGGYGASPTNQLITNFKKPMDRQGSAEWHWKLDAINKVGSMLRRHLATAPGVAIVPVPPSKAKGDPLYDDRLIQALKVAAQGIAHLDVREVVHQPESIAAFHDSDSRRPTPDQLALRYRVDERLLDPEPKEVFIFDDVVTTGSHFKATQSLLRKHWPHTRISGLFIARRIINYDFDF